MTEMMRPDDNTSFDNVRLAPGDIPIREIALRDLWQSLRAGIADFSAKPGSAIPFLILFYALFAVVISLFAFGQQLRYLVFPVVTGFTLIGPIIAIGFFEISRRREQGLDLRWRAAFGFVHTSSFAPVLALSLLMALLYTAWLYMAELIFFSLFGDSTFASTSEFINEVLSTRRGGALIAYGNFVGFLFAFGAMAMSVVAFPLALDKPVTSFTAVSVSIRAFSANVVVLVVWGLTVVAVLALGAALFLIGLAVALPILGHSTWHLYRRIIGPDNPSEPSAD